MLTEKQIQARRLGIGGSDAMRVMWGTAQEWRELYDEKVSDIRPEFNEKTQLLMDLGNAVEPLTLKVFDKKHHKLRVLEREEMVYSKVDPFFFFTPDGITADDRLPVQCKFHTGDKDIISLAEYYSAQLIHEMMCCGVKKMYLAVIFGHYGRFQHLEINYDEEAADIYLQRAFAFKRYIETGEEPDWMVSGTTMKVERKRDHYWDEGDNQVKPLATKIIECHQAAKDFESAVEELKKLVPDDCASARWIGSDGTGMMFKVSSNGAKRLQLIAPEKPEDVGAKSAKVSLKKKVKP